MSSLTSAITSTFIQALGRQSQGSSLSSELRGALNGSSKNTDSVKVSLRAGAQAYASAYQGLNALISYVSVSKDSIDKLDKITDKLVDLTKEAERSDTSSQARANLDLRFHKLTKEFKGIVDTAVTQGQNYLTTDGLGYLFNIFGLDKSNSESIGALFKEFVTPAGDTSLASQEEKATHPHVPGDAFVNPVQVTSVVTDYSKIFDTDRRITNRPEAYRMAADLGELKKQIKKNQLALDDATQVVSDNMKLAQGAGLAFLDVSNLKDIGDAEKAAIEVQQKIRENVPGALAQAENLQPMAVAMLVLAQANAQSSSNGN